MVKKYGIIIAIITIFMCAHIIKSDAALARRETPPNQDGTCKICSLGPQRMVFQCINCGKEISVLDAQLVTTITDYYTKSGESSTINQTNVTADVLNVQNSALSLPEDAISGPHWHKYRCPSCGAVTSTYIADLKEVELQKTAEANAQKKEELYLEEQRKALQQQQEYAKQQQEITQRQEEDRESDRNQQQLKTAADMIVMGAGMGGPGATCFIATAAYGSPDAADVMVLREFRDKCLLSNVPGRLFVDLYYRISPPIARYIANDEKRKEITRRLLTPLVRIARFYVNR